MITVSDSTPLIHFGAIKRLDLLRSMYGQIFITKVIQREVVTEGIALGKQDAFLVEKEIGDSDRSCKPEKATRVNFVADMRYTLVRRNRSCSHEN